MVNIFVMQHNYRSRYLGTTDKEQSIVSVYIYEECKCQEAFIVLKFSKIFSLYFGINRIIRTTETSEACDSSDFDGNTILVRSDNIGNNIYVFFSGFEFINSTTEDKTISFISPIDNNMIPTAIAIEKNYTCFISDHYNFIEYGKIEKGILLISTNGIVNP